MEKRGRKKKYTLVNRGQLIDLYNNQKLPVCLIEGCFVSAKFGPLMIFLRRLFTYNLILQVCMSSKRRGLLKSIVQATDQRHVLSYLVYQ